MMDDVTPERIADFQETVWRYYDRHGRRGMPWRDPEEMALPGLPEGEFDPYRIMVSELMLQQTQVARVIPKFQAFMTLFPSAAALAAASLGEVLVAWQGLGYNRRAKFLWQAAQLVTEEYGGLFPRDLPGLVRLPGVGVNTAGAIITYAYDQPAAFVETNIRTVYIHHFFDDQTAVPDKQVLDLVQASLPSDQAKTEGLGPRQWYWALMDYGTYLKQTVGNKSRASKSYSKQSPFHGSKRQVRGAVIRQLSHSPATLEDLSAGQTDERLPEVLADLVREGMVRRQDDRYSLA